MIHHLFPTLVYTGSNLDILETSKILFDKCTDMRPCADGFSTTLVEYSPGNCLVSWDFSNEPETQSLTGFIKQSVTEYMEQMQIASNAYHIEIPNMWLNEMESGGYHRPRNHYGYTFSGTYYIDCPADSGKIQFHGVTEDWFFQKLKNVTQWTTGNSATWWIPVEVGSIIIFPSYLKHSVPPATYEGNRRSIAFDIIMKPVPLD
jgi:uncharacterized protein (TIGR02466 family)